MKRIYIIALAAGVLALAGCQHDEISPVEYPLSDGVIRFAPGIAAVSSDNGQIKSEASMEEATEACVLTSEDGSIDLPIFCEVMPGIGTYGATDEDVAGTKATLINDPGSETGSVLPLDNFASSIDNTFWVSAWNTPAEGDKVKIIPDNPTGTALAGYVSGSATNGWYQKVAYRDGVSSSKYWMTIQKQTVTGTGVPSDADDEYIWKKGETKTFFAYANLPTSGASISNTTATSQTLELTALPDEDILLGFYQGDGYSGDPAKMTGTAGIHFYHPLSAVKFKLGTIEGTDITITGISIEGVYNKGKTSQDASTGTNFVWTNTEGTATVNLSDVVVGDNQIIGEPILLIPQKFAADSKARIIVEFSDGSALYTPLAGKEWKAGYTTTYTIGLERNIIDVSVSETFNGTTKSNVAVRNTGTANAFVRATVVANWVTSEGMAIQACDLAGLTFNTTDWTLSNGFYYCKKAIRPGNSTPNLFDTFTAPSPKPDESLHLEMTVIAQGIALDYEAASTYSAKANTAWGITGVLENAIQD